MNPRATSLLAIIKNAVTIEKLSILTSRTKIKRSGQLKQSSCIYVCTGGTVFTRTNVNLARLQLLEVILQSPKRKRNLFSVTSERSKPSSSHYRGW